MIIKSEPFATYLAREGLNPSAFKAKRNPQEVFYEMNSPRVDKPEFILGRLFHTLLVEPAMFESHFRLVDNKTFPIQIYLDEAKTRISMRYPSNRGHFQHCLTIAKGEKIDVVTDTIYNVASAMVQAVERDNGIACIERFRDKSAYVETTMLGIAIFDDSGFQKFEPLHFEGYKAKKSEILVKTRPDFFTHDILIDVKTDKEISPRIFAKTCLYLGYDIQLSFAIDLHNAIFPDDPLPDDNVFILAVEKKEPYQSVIYKCPESMIQTGRDRYRKRLEWIKIAIDTGKWVGFNIYSDQTLIDSGMEYHAVSLPFPEISKQNLW
uniref:Putative exodeoxyribonuclease 8 PDDEXK-like domain-containing protein n=1 Tax=viral metagenome TaxID=1070528 RepID=A0A6M3ITI9_9ZZZZ